jgi:PIN domain nuclease of toxin-antitoxin system
MPSFFADSYALIEMLKGNENYRAFQSERLITTEFNICEVGFAVCRNYPANAPQVLNTVRKMVTLTATRNEDYCSGAARRKEASGKGKKLSTIDCVGYSVANRLKIPFLTGDREFADMNNVQFVR